MRGNHPAGVPSSRSRRRGAFLVVASALVLVATTTADSSGRSGASGATSDRRRATARALPRTITTVASEPLGDGGPAATASIHRPEDVAVSADDDVFFTDLSTHTIRAIDARTGTIRTVVGNGFSGEAPDLAPSPTDVPLGWPFGIVFDAQDNLIFADFTEHRIRFVNRGGTPVTAFGTTIPAGAMEAIAGDGFKDDAGIGRFTGDGVPATESSLNFPRGVTLDAEGNLYFNDIDNLRVRRVDVQTGIITTVAGDGSLDLEDGGDGGPATKASVRFPTSIAFDADGELHIAEFVGTIRRVDHRGRIHTIAGTASFEDAFGGDGGPATAALIGQNPKSLTFDDGGNLLFADAANNRVRRIDAGTRIITTVAGPGKLNPFGVYGFSITDVHIRPTDADLGIPTGLAFRDGRLLVVSEFGSMLWTIDPGSDGSVDGDASERIEPLITGGRFKSPVTIEVDGAGGLLVSSRTRAELQRVDPAGVITPLAGTGVFPLSIDGEGGDPRDDLGDGGPAGEATVSPFLGLSLAPNGDLYLTDWAAHRVRRIEAGAGASGGPGTVGPTSTIETVAKLPFLPEYLAVAGPRRIFVSDPDHRRIWRLNGDTGERAVIAGSGRAGYAGDGGPATQARIRCIVDLELDRAGRHLYFSDPCTGVVRVVDLRRRTIHTVVDLRPSAPFHYAVPLGLAVLGNRFLFVVDEEATQVVRVDLRSREREAVPVAGSPYAFTTGFTGDDRPATRTVLDGANFGVALDGAGKLYIAEEAGQRVRRVGVTDILPGVFPNRIDLRSEGSVPVAILGTPGVPAISLEPIKIRVAGATPAPTGSVLQDVNGDGLLDLVVQVRIQDLELGPKDFEVRIVARTYDGHRITDADWVTPFR